MAQRRTIQFIDDLDQAEVSDGGQTLTFALQMAQYEIDLSPVNAQKLYDALAPFIAAGRRVRGRASSQVVTGPTAESNQLQAIRQWAKSQGIKVSDRGRLPKVVHVAYDAAR